MELVEQYTNLKNTSNTFEELQEDVLRKIDQSFKDIQDGKYSTMEEAVLELEKEYGLSRE